MKPTITIIQPTKEEEIKRLKELVNKIISGFQFLFISLTIGIITQGVTSWKWIDLILKGSIFTFTAILIILKNKMDKKAYEEKKRGEN